MNKIKKFETCEDSPSAFVFAEDSVFAGADGDYRSGSVVFSAKKGDDLIDAMLAELAKVPT